MAPAWFHVIAWSSLLGCWAATWLACSIGLPPYPTLADQIGPQPSAALALSVVTGVWLIAIRRVKARVEM